MRARTTGSASISLIDSSWHPGIAASLWHRRVLRAFARTLLVTSVCVKIKSEESFTIGRPLKYFRMTQRPLDVAIARSPMLLHAETRKLVILGMAFIVPGAIN